MRDMLPVARIRPHVGSHDLTLVAKGDLLLPNAERKQGQ